jgi:hypothetical protein
MPLPTGNLNFNVADVVAADVAAAFQSFLDRGSKTTGVSLDNIDLGVVRLPANPGSETLVDLLKVGVKIFDATVWLTKGRPATHKLRVDPAKTEDSIPSLADIANALIYTFFFQLTQARYPFYKGPGYVESPDNQPSKVPKFLVNVLGLKDDQSHYIGLLTSFPPEKFDPSWIKEVKLTNFGQEILSRFGLGVAGYRLFGPFKLYSPKEGITAETKRAYDFARTVAIAKPTWDIHPTTRNPSVLTARGNLNKNLANLILDCFDDVQIEEMVKTRALYAKPVRDPAHINYRTWTDNDDISGSSFIFRSV